MLFQRINDNPALNAIVCAECSEFDEEKQTSIGINIDPRIPADDVIILKVDAFYNSLNIERRPKSPDCLILVTCPNGGFALTIVELKNTVLFDTIEIIEKFETCLTDFMTVQFPEYFDIDFQRIHLVLVSLKESYHREKGLRASALMNKRFKFRNKRCWIEPHEPTPTVKPCYY
jgi:hypothetical protein